LVFRSDSSIWNLPGGEIENAETPEKASIRETFEETGFQIKLLYPLGTYNNIDVNTGGVWNKVHLFEGVVISGIFKPEFPGCKGQWFSINKLPKEIKPVTIIRIKDAFDYAGKSFIKRFRPAGPSDHTATLKSD